MVIVRQEGESLLAAYLEHHQSAAGAGHVDDACPQALPHSGTDISNIDTGREF
jgi:hypothetical protein